MSEISCQFSHLLMDERCSKCGRHWVYEKSAWQRRTCPFCAGERIDVAEVAVMRFERSNRSLRAYIKRKNQSKPN